MNKASSPVSVFTAQQLIHTQQESCVIEPSQSAPTVPPMSVERGRRAPTSGRTEDCEWVLVLPAIWRVHGNVFPIHTHHLPAFTAAVILSLVPLPRGSIVGGLLSRIEDCWRSFREKEEGRETSLPLKEDCYSCVWYECRHTCRELAELREVDYSSG